MALVLKNAPPTLPITALDIEELVNRFHPAAVRPRAAVSLATSGEGLRHDVLGRSEAARRDVQHALSTAELAGFVAERVARPGRRGGVDVFIRERWIPGCWTGRSRLLSHLAQRDDEFYDHLVDWFGCPPNGEVCSLLLRAIARDADRLAQLPPPPGLEPAESLYERTIGWFASAIESVGVRAE